MSTGIAAPSRRAIFTPTRTASGILVALFGLSLAVPGLAQTWGLLAYFGLVVLTGFVVNGVRGEPGSWLGRRVVRRMLVLAVAAVCVGLMTVGPPTAEGSGGLVLFVFVLILLNVALGRATQRMATAPDSLVDERQEALRNQAHRLAYVLLALLVGGVVVVADVATTQSREWLSGVVRGSGWIVFLELIFVLPAMVVAVLEPDRLPPEWRRAPRQTVRARAAAVLLVLTLAVPVSLSLLLLVLPVGTSATTSVRAAPLPVGEAGAGGAVLGCRTFNADALVGRGIQADIPLSAEACWNGRFASESYGMNASDCLIRDFIGVNVTTIQCTRTTAPDGTLRFIYRTTVASSLLPFVTRDVILQIVIDRHGKVVQFP